METSNIILKRNVFWSMLEYELPIPEENQAIYTAIMGHPLEVGKRHDINLIIDGKKYNAYFRNEGFNRNTFDHPEIVMLTYGAAVRKKLKEIFHYSYEQLLIMRNQIEAEQIANGTRRRIITGELNNPEEYIVLSATSDENTFILDCITKENNTAAKESISSLKEELYENDVIFDYTDEKASISYSSAIHKIRHLDRSIGNTLKKLYNYRCQMTGERIGEKEDAFCVEAHHIIPFTESLNNDYSNIIILSPNYHRIVHKANPIFNYKELAFKYPNGLVEKVKLNKHLKS